MIIICSGNIFLLFFSSYFLLKNEPNVLSVASVRQKPTQFNRKLYRINADIDSNCLWQIPVSKHPIQMKFIKAVVIAKPQRMELVVMRSRMQQVSSSWHYLSCCLKEFRLYEMLEDRNLIQEKISQMNEVRSHY